MAESEAKERKQQVDEGLERGIQGLTQERIEKVINRVLASETGARLKAYVETCVHCGLCSEACHFFSPTTGTPGSRRWARSSRPCGR
jgi:ferredoxin